MSKTDRYVQCTMKQNEKYHTSWIPKKYAIQGKMISLKEFNWSNWEIIQLGSETDYENVSILESSHRTMRSVTDI